MIGIGNIRYEFLVHFLEEAIVIIAAHKIPRGVVGKRNRIGTGFQLCPPKVDRSFFHFLQALHRLAWIIIRHQQKLFDTKAVVAQRPRTHRFADHADFVSKLFFQNADRVKHAFRIGVCEKVVRNLDILRFRPDRFVHFDGRPVVFFLPLHLATQGRRLLNDRKDGHDRIEAKLCVTGLLPGKPSSPDHDSPLENSRRPDPSIQRLLPRLDYKPECGQPVHDAKRPAHVGGWSSGQLEKVCSCERINLF